MNDRTERRLKLETLRVLMEVAQAGSMGKAAERLHTSQPNISRSIAELERALGVRLLDRRRQGVEPTQYGRALLDCGVTVFDDLRQGLKNIEFLADPTKGEVRIGIVPFAMSFVSDIVDRLSQRCPHIVFHIATAEVETLHDQLIGRKVDLLIAKTIGPFVGERFKVQPLFNDPYVVVAGTQHPLARRRTVKPAELAMQAWALPPPESVYGADLARVFQAVGVNYPRATVYTIPQQPSRPSGRDWSLPYDFSRFRAEGICRGGRAQGIARQACSHVRICRSHYAEKSHAQSRSTAFHRECRRRRKVPRETDMRS